MSTQDYLDAAKAARHHAQKLVTAATAATHHAYSADASPAAGAAARQAERTAKAAYDAADQSYRRAARAYDLEQVAIDAYTLARADGLPVEHAETEAYIAVKHRAGSDDEADIYARHAKHAYAAEQEAAAAREEHG